MAAQVPRQEWSIELLPGPKQGPALKFQYLSLSIPDNVTFSLFYLRIEPRPFLIAAQVAIDVCGVDGGRWRYFQAAASRGHRRVRWAADFTRYSATGVNTACPSSGGTAFPIWTLAASKPPSKTKSSGKD